MEQIHPTQEDYFVLKPLHSAFYQTPFETLLRYLNVKTLILGGMATNSCILCTAHDAKMRDFKLFVPSDCSAAKSAKEHRQAIQHIAEMTDAETMVSTSLRLKKLKTKTASR